MKLVSVIFYPEPHPILFKNSEKVSAETNENKVFKFDYAEPRCNIKNRQISTK